LELEENNIAVVCISDSKYLVYLKTMLKSLCHSNNNFVVHACLINIKKKVSVKKSLEKIYSNIKIDFLDQEFNKTHHLKAFCANHRAEFIKQVLEINYDALIYSDVDSIFRDRISLEKIITPEADIKVLFRDNDNKKFKVAAGVIFFKQNNLSRKFVQAWADNLRLKKLEWFADQITFFETYELLKDEVSIRNLEAEYIDWEFHEQSSIWAGKGSRKKRNIIYLIETLSLNAKNRFIKKILGYMLRFFRATNQYLGR
jgi:lipopolysaccharide biosynthesis glycosyltransferase